MRFPHRCICSQPGQCSITGKNVSKGYIQECQVNAGFRKRIAEMFGDNPKLPGFVRQAINFGKAVLRHVSAGCPKVPDEELSRRRMICESCEQWVDGKCAKCGCKTQAKAAWALEKCPLGKWELPVIST